MLVLTRRINERIMLSDGVTIMVVGIDGCRVQLGFDAPRDIKITREELLTPRPAPEGQTRPWCPACKTFCFQLAGGCSGCGHAVEQRPAPEGQTP